MKYSFWPRGMAAAVLLLCMSFLCLPVQASRVEEAPIVTTAQDVKPEEMLDLSEVDGIGVLSLSFRSDAEEVSFGAVYAADMLQDGRGCLITVSRAGQYAQKGLVAELKGGNISADAEYLGTSGLVSFFAVTEPEGIGSGSIRSMEGVYFQALYARSGSDAVLSEPFSLDAFEACEGYYLLAYDADSNIPEGAPVVCCENGQVWGMVSRTESGAMMIVDLTTVSLPEEKKADAAVVPPAKQEHAEAEASRTLPYGGIATAGLLAAAAVVGLCAAAKKAGKKHKGKKTGGLWQIRCVQGSRCGEVFPLKRKLVIGRSREADVVFPEDTAGVSGKHCALTVSGGSVFLQDLNSRYGTFVGKDLSQKLQPQKNRELKNTELFSLSQGGPVFRLESYRKGTGNGIYGVYGPDGVCYMPDAGNVITIGRKDSCTVRFAPGNTAVSSDHCKLFLENGTVYLMDTGSTNGTYFIDHSRLMPYEKYAVEHDTVFYLSDPVNCFRVTMQNKT